MQGAGGERATRSYPQHCLGATDHHKMVQFQNDSVTKQDQQQNETFLKRFRHKTEQLLSASIPEGKVNLSFRAQN
jgi:hypothetical protein